MGPMGCSYQRVHALGFTEPGVGVGRVTPIGPTGAHGAVQGRGGQPTSGRPGDSPIPALAHLECSFPSIHSKGEFSRHLSLVTTLIQLKN